MDSSFLLRFLALFLSISEFFIWKIYYSTIIKKIYKDVDKNVLKILNVKNSMNSKKSYGGTASNNVAMMIKKYKKEIK